MRRFLSVITAVLAIGALTSPPASAVTNGDADGNQHPNVGALIYQVPGDAGYVIGCSGSLLAVGGSHAAVFLTAGHCVFAMENVLPADTDYAVSFDSDLALDDDGFVHPASTVAVVGSSMNPAFLLSGANHRDLGVVFLAAAPAGLEPATLPAIGADAAVVGTDVLSVGYGANELDRSISSPNSTLVYTGKRTSGEGLVNGLSPNWLSSHADDAATCYGDSGGPQLTSDGVMVSITITGDMPCRSVTKSQRLDLEDVQAWLQLQTA